MSTKLRKCLSLVLVTMLLASISISGAFTASADTQTGDGLAAYAMTAYNEGWQYVWGGASYGYVDCSGLIYSYGVGGGRTTEQMLAAATESGYVSDGVPDIPGIGLWQPGHVGVYVGNGMAVDARDEVSNVCYSSVDSKSWVMWFKIAGVTYGDTGVTNQTQPTDTSSNTVDTDTSKSDVILEKGDSGADVNALQERLKVLGYFQDNTTEYFGSYTESCLIEFQKAAGLDATGVYNEATQKALMADDAPAIVPESKTEADSNKEGSESTATDSEVQGIESDITDMVEDASDSDSEATYFEETEADSAESEVIDTYSAQVEEGMTDTEDSDDGNLFANFDEYDTSDDTESDTDDLSGYMYQAGYNGEDIVSIQQKLTDLQYYYGEINGIYNDETAYAVARYQYDGNLSVTGVIDEPTWELLFTDINGEDEDTDTDSSEKTENFYLKEGMATDEVTDMQDKLIELRYMTGSASGVYDEATALAVQLFQEVNGFSATRYINEEQFDLLLSDNAEKSPEYGNLMLGYEGEDVINLQNILVSMSYLDYSSLTQLGLYDETTKGAVIKAQNDFNVEASGTANEEFVTMLQKQSQKEQTSTTTNAVVSASNATTSALSSAVTNVDVPKTGVESYINKTFTAVVIGVTMLVILFVITVHYWNVSMEKRRKRARKMTTVSGYRRRYM